MKDVLACLFLALTIGVSSPAQQTAVTRLDGSRISGAEIDQAVNRLMKAAEVIGVAVAIFDHGKLAYVNAFGFRDKDKNLALTADSVMSAASITETHIRVPGNATRG